MTNALALRYPEVYWSIKVNLEARGIEVITIFRTENIWCRDWMPVQINGEYFRFYHKTSKKYPQLDVSNEPWSGVVAPIRCLPFTLDGGNVVYHNGKIIMTEKVIQDNGISVTVQLEKVLNCEIIIIPIEPGDTLGHSDGIVKFVDDNHVIINNYAQIGKKDKRFYEYRDTLLNILEGYGLTVDQIPNAYDAWNWNLAEKDFRMFFPRADDYNPAYGYYINFLKVSDVIFLPAMKIKRDLDAFKAIEAQFPGRSIIMVDCSRLSFEGGLVHCVTWNGVK